eukprot:8761652-Lingulodinium_polyedra.AAC.1
MDDDEVDDALPLRKGPSKKSGCRRELPQLLGRLLPQARVSALTLDSKLSRPGGRFVCLRALRSQR